MFNREAPVLTFVMPNSRAGLPYNVAPIPRWLSR
jgi:hypothetical protein